MDKKAKIKVLISILVSVIFVSALGLTYSFLVHHVGTGSSTDASLLTKKTDHLYFTNGNPLNFQADMDTFGVDGENLTSSTISSATLVANNNTQSATSTYNVYFDIAENGYNYTVNSSTPEIILEVTKPDGTKLTSTNGLNYVTSGGVTGFDVTTKTGTFVIYQSYSISSNNSVAGVTQNWIFKITYINLDSDQMLNEGQPFRALVKLSNNFNSTERIVVDKDDNMIPIMYDATCSVASVADQAGGCWVKADITNASADYSWYDYDNHKWANAATINNNITLARDLSGNGRNGTYYNIMRTDNGIYFNGSNSYVNIPQVNLSFPLTYSVTFSTEMVGNQIIFGDYLTKAGLGLYQSNTQFIVKTDSGGVKVFYSGGIELNRSYTIDIVYTSVTDMKVYKDGVELSETGANNYWVWDSSVSYLGKRPSGTYFKGTISEFLIYQSALSSNQINQNLNAKHGLVGGDGKISNNLKLYYDFYPQVEIYKNLAVGTPIPYSDVMGYFVYIPRYSYMLFNVNDDGDTSIDEQEIVIDFENVNVEKSTGTTNSARLTHPAFTFGDEELNGFWVGKFEMSYPSDSNGEKTAATVLTTGVTVKPSINTQTMYSLRGMSISNFYLAITALKNGSNGTYTNSNHNLSSYESNVMKNTQWGAVTYLSQSIYGVCTGTKGIANCDNQPQLNSVIGGMNTAGDTQIGEQTGCGPTSNNSILTSSTCNYYYTTLGKLASTTQNIYGVYDMAGGAFEYMMATMYSSDNTSVYAGRKLDNVTKSSGFYGGSSGRNCIIYDDDNDISQNITSGTALIPENKYYDIYQYHLQSEYDFNRGYLGDALREIGKNDISGENGWYKSNPDLPNEYVGSWITRGYSASGGEYSSIFGSTPTMGSFNDMISTRMVILK